MVAKYNFQKYRILTVIGEKAQACAQFLYKGYEISFSQISPFPTEVAVFADEGKEAKPVHECHTVEGAIKWVDENAAG